MGSASAKQPSCWGLMRFLCWADGDRTWGWDSRSPMHRAKRKSSCKHCSSGFVAPGDFTLAEQSPRSAHSSVCHPGQQVCVSSVVQSFFTAPPTPVGTAPSSICSRAEAAQHHRRCSNNALLCGFNHFPASARPRT